MRFRRQAGLVDAIRSDGSERALRALGAVGAVRPNGIEIVTGFGRALVRAGQWLTRDLATGALRVVEDADFRREHEPLDPSRRLQDFDLARAT